MNRDGLWCKYAYTYFQSVEWKHMQHNPNCEASVHRKFHKDIVLNCARCPEVNLIQVEFTFMDWCLHTEGSAACLRLIMLLHTLASFKAFGYMWDASSIKSGSFKGNERKKRRQILWNNVFTLNIYASTLLNVFLTGMVLLMWSRVESILNKRGFAGHYYWGEYCASCDATTSL